MDRVVADAGLLIAADRNDRSVWALKKDEDLEIVVPAPVLAQVWRGPGSASLGRFLRGLEVIPFTDPDARRVGELLALASTDDVVDAAVAIAARAGDRIITSDPDDLEVLVERRGVEVSVRRI